VKLERHEQLYILLGVGWALTLCAAGSVGAAVAAAGSMLFLLVSRLDRAGNARFLTGYLATWILYAGSTPFVEHAGLSDHGEALARCDVWLFGQSPATFFSDLSFWQIEFLSAGYLTYHGYLHWALIDAMRRDGAWRSAFARCLYLAFGIGFLGYSLYQALAMVDAGPVTRLNGWINDHMAARYDAFPSLHVLVTGAILLWDYRHLRWRFKIMILPSLVMLVSTIALRFHYIIDVLVSLLVLAALALFATTSTDRTLTATPQKCRGARSFLRLRFGP
jgi:membrane-associated phospholipid phosphatase